MCPALSGPKALRFSSKGERNIKFVGYGDFRFSALPAIKRQNKNFVEFQIND